jgi:hypothetical protein
MLPALRTAVYNAPPEGSFPVFDAWTNERATNNHCEVVKLQWLVPGAAGVVVIGDPASLNFV